MLIEKDNTDLSQLYRPGYRFNYPGSRRSSKNLVICTVTFRAVIMFFSRRSSDAADGFTEGWGRGEQHNSARAQRVREWVRRGHQ
jgi:hypothetical protein